MSESPREPRIISASRRTDIPAFYTEWYARRVAAGWCEVANPFSGKTHRVSLEPRDVLAWVFWSRDYGRFVSVLEHLHGLGQRFLCHFTITNFPSLLEPRTIAAEEAVAQAHTMAANFGCEVVQWRYDPVLLSSVTPPDWHLENFARLAEGLRGATRRCIFSFPQMYRKTARNLARLENREVGEPLRIWTPGDSDSAAAHFNRADLKSLVEGLHKTADEADMELQVCCGPEWITCETPVTPAHCIDWPLLQALGAGLHLRMDSDRSSAQADLFGEVGGRQPPPALPPVRRQASRKGCGCWSSIDIGAYETCAHGCAYCYAVDSPRRALDHLARHNPQSPRLGA